MRWLAVTVALALLVAIGGGAAVRYATRTPHGGDLAVIIEVQPGARLRGVLAQLSQANVLRYPDLVYLYARITKHTRVRSGTYKVSATQSPLEIMRMLDEGHVLLQSFTIAEGLNRWQVRDLLAGQGWMSASEFDTLCDDQHFLAEAHVPGPSCEGYLFPETYKFARGTAPKDLFLALFNGYKRQVKIAMARAHTPVPLSEREFATLASIVEKETGAAEERPRIACVFFNRLRATPPWKLETDPTVIYAATLADPRFDGNIKRYHLHQLDSPYNTYRRVGLPPGPIANPGAGALSAVAAPMACDDYFFVSKNHGRHIFCPTLSCHKKAVQRYQIEYFRKQRSAANSASTAPQTVAEDAEQTAVKARALPSRKTHEHARRLRAKRRHRSRD